jgi:hypothetical protein
VFDTKLYTGTGSTQTISGLGFSPDLVWLKNRVNNEASHVLNDTNRGANKRLSSNLTAAEDPNSLYGYLSAFTSDGFTLTPGSSGADLVCQNTISYAAWAWDAGSSTVTNTAGTISSQVRANTSAGFSVVTYTGNGTAGASVGHGLGVSPGLIIVKARTSINDGWPVYHSALGNTNFLGLNLTIASTAGSTVWNNTTPSSSIITFGNSSGVNSASYTYVAYCFAPVTGYSAFGSYTGNGSADGPFAYLGFRPAFLMMKRTDTTGNWTIFDNKRLGYNADNDAQYPNLAAVDGTGDLLDITSNGFKLRSTNADVNASGGTYIYAAFAENPFQYSRAR